MIIYGGINVGGVKTKGTLLIRLECSDKRGCYIIIMSCRCRVASRNILFDWFKAAYLYQVNHLVLPLLEENLDRSIHITG